MGHKTPRDTHDSYTWVKWPIINAPGIYYKTDNSQYMIHWLNTQYKYAIREQRKTTKRGVPRNKRNPPGSATVCVCVCVNVGWGRPVSQRPWWLPRHSSRDLAVQGSPTLASQTGGHHSPVECTPALWQTLGSPHPSLCHTDTYISRTVYNWRERLSQRM